MKLGLYLEDGPPTAEAPARYLEDLLEQTRVARESGFDLLTTGHHYFTIRPHFQPFPLLARMTQESGDMTVGVTIFLLPLHHPVEVAHQVTTLSYLAERVVLGVGVGARVAEYDAFGLDRSTWGPRLAEGVDLLHLLLTEDDVTYDGEVFSVEGVTLSARPETRPEIWVGATVPRTIRRAARRGDAWIVGSRPDLDAIRSQKEAHYDPIREESGRSTAVPMIRECLVRPTSEEAWALAEEHLRPIHQFYQRANPQQDQDVTTSASFREFAEERCFVGTADEVADGIRRYREAIDISHLIVRVQPPGVPKDVALDTIRTLGEDVFPEL